MTDQQLIEEARYYIANRYDTDYKVLIRCFEAVVDRFSALQAENAGKDKEIKRLKSELLEAIEDYMASEMEREQGVDTLSRVKAERDTAHKEIERLKKCRHECKIDCLLEDYNRVCEKLACVEAERGAAVELLRRLPDSCCGCKYAVDGEACQCSECDDADTEHCTEECPWWGDPCGLCDDKDSWTFCGAQGEG